MTPTTQLPMTCPVCKRPVPKAGDGFCSVACASSVEAHVADFWRESAASWIEIRAIREYRRAKDGESYFQ